MTFLVLHVLISPGEAEPRLSSATLYRTYISYIHYSSLTLNVIKSEYYLRFGDCLVIFGYLSGVNEALMSSPG